MPFPLIAAIAAGLTARSAHKAVTTHRVEFKAKKKVSKPVAVDFKTKSGKEIAFRAKKSVTEKVPVKFRAKNAKMKK
jgi:hypothetical protein